MENLANLFVVSAPSGAGKSSLIKKLSQDLKIYPSISHTTRKPRGQEKDGKEYFFVSDEKFEEMIQNNKFIEWADVHDFKYGTSKQSIENKIQNNEDILLEIDYQGALQIKNIFPSETILIFILPPSWQELKKRLQNRAEDNEEIINLRLKNALLETQQIAKFDFVIINESFEQALAELKIIIQAQKLKYQQQKFICSDVFKNLNLD